MMDFTYRLEQIRTDALTLDYFLVPWDTEIMAQPVAEIRHIEVRDPDQAEKDYPAFIHWCKQQKISLCSCRLAQDQIVESMFLEDHGFRFIELNYRPRLANLQALELPEDAILVEPARSEDQKILAEMAGTVFGHGRFHQDPRLGAQLGNQRYRAWLLNGFEQPHQKVFKCLRDGEIVAFFVVEYPEQGHCFWSLVGLAPGLQGQGLGKRVWRTMLRWHRHEGIDTITTSITSHNVAVFNLYISLGFRFPSPTMTFHWLSPGARPLH